MTASAESDFVEAVLATATKIPEGGRQRLESWLDDVLRKQYDLEWASDFQNMCPVAGAHADDYLHRCLKSAGQPTLMAGIRFKAGALDWPFVELLAWDRPIHSWDDPVARARQAFAKFAPRAVRISAFGDARPDYSSAATVDQFVLGETISALVACAVRPNALETRVATDLSFLPTYEQLFRRWQKGARELGRRVEITREVEWQHCLDEGLILCVFDDEGKWAGVMAGASAFEGLFDGMSVWELFLSERLRGRGLAPSLQRNFIVECARRLSGHQYVLGTIDAENRPSLRTAFACGRRVLETRWFLA